MTTSDFVQISAFLRPDQIERLDAEAKRRGIHGRQPLLRWAVDHYLDFLLSESSTYRSEQQDEQPAAADIAA